MAEEATASTTETTTAEEAATTSERAEKVYKQADVDSITAKVRTGLETKLRAAEAEAERLRTANQTEEEKKLAEARAEGANEVQAQLEALKRENSIKLALIAKGVPESQLDRYARLVDADADPKEAVDALAKETPQLFQAFKPTNPGPGGRSPASGQSGVEMTVEGISEYLRDPNVTQAQKREFLNKHKDHPALGGGFVQQPR